MFSLEENSFRRQHFYNLEQEELILNKLFSFGEFSFKSLEFYLKSSIIENISMIEKFNNKNSSLQKIKVYKKT